MFMYVTDVTQHIIMPGFTCMLDAEARKFSKELNLLLLCLKIQYSN